MEWYWFHLFILEILSESEEYKYRHSDIDMLCKCYSIDIALLSVIIKYLVDNWFFRSDKEYFGSNYLDERMKLKESEKKNKSIAWKIGANKRRGKSQWWSNNNSSRIADDGNKSKVNKKKEKEIKIYNKEEYVFVDNFLDKENAQIKYQIEQKWDSYFQKQYEEINRLIKDWYDIKTIQIVLQFIRQDDFWRKNIMSISKLRQKDKNGIPYIVRMISAIQNWKPKEKEVPIF